MERSVSGGIILAGALTISPGTTPQGDQSLGPVGLGFLAGGQRQRWHRQMHQQHQQHQQQRLGCRQRKQPPCSAIRAGGCCLALAPSTAALSLLPACRLCVLSFSHPIAYFHSLPFHRVFCLSAHLQKSEFRRRCPAHAQQCTRRASACGMAGAVQHTLHTGTHTSWSRATDRSCVLYIAGSHCKFTQDPYPWLAVALDPCCCAHPQLLHLRQQPCDRPCSDCSQHSCHPCPASSNSQ